MGKLLRLDQWNFYTKNVNHITTIEKWFEITDWLHLEIESFYFSDFEIEHGVLQLCEPPDWDVSLGAGTEARIWALMLGFKPWSQDLSLKAEI